MTQMCAIKEPKRVEGHIEPWHHRNAVGLTVKPDRSGELAGPPQELDGGKVAVVMFRYPRHTVTALINADDLRIWTAR